MAKQLGRFKYEKTLGCITFYRRGDKWYARQKSSLSRRRVKTSKEFANTMKSAHRLGRAAKHAAAVYSKLPESWKLFELYRKLTGIAVRLLKEGRGCNDIRHALEQQLYNWGYRKEISCPVVEASKGDLKFKVQGLRPSTPKCKKQFIAVPVLQEKLSSQRRIRRKRGRFEVLGIRRLLREFVMLRYEASNPVAQKVSS
ncbi:MAG: hypothetical protein QM731_05915 [Chitinophagaceae bacterium]